MRSFLLPGVGLFVGLLFLAPLVRGDGQLADKLAAALKPDPDPKKSTADLPLTKIVLFNAGIGYFQREGDVSGDAHFDLRFDETDINDLLKTLVLTDKDGGKIRAVTYDNRMPVEFTLKGFVIDVTENPTIGQLLHQVRGEKIEVTDKGGVITTGQIVSVGRPTPPTIPSRPIPDADGDQPRPPVPSADPGEFLNILTEDGLQSVELKQLKKIKLLRPELQAEFRMALELLASSRGDNKKTVSVVFSGKGKRRVAIGYVTEAPLWKPSYRLSVDEKGATRIQGWATVENTTDEDWNDVKIGLVAGRPMTFQMDLYDPLFVPRPTVEPELFASLRSPMYQGGLNPAANMGMVIQMNPAGIGGGQFGGGQFGASQIVGAQGQPGQPGGQFGFQGGFGFGGSPYPPRFARPDQRTLYGQRLSYTEYLERVRGKAPQNAGGEGVQAVRDPLDRKAGALAVADGSLGDMFEYNIEEKVSLPRQKSAMLPFVNEAVEGSRVSIYNSTVLARYPLLGLKLVNKTRLHLAQGPVAVYDGGTYAGDARLPDLKPGETRLVSYAIDLGMEVVLREGTPSIRTIDGVTVTLGSLMVQTRNRWTTKYVVRNRNAQDRTLIIEHPRHDDRKLIAPEKPTDETRSFYRFEMPVKAGELATLEVVEESSTQQTYALANTDVDTLLYYSKLETTKPAVRIVLKKVLELRGKITEAQKAINGEQLALKEIAEDQDRIRKNIERAPKESETFKRYLKKFDDQETEIEKRQARIKELKTDLVKQEEDFRVYATTAGAG
jgi:hypothetical protein